MDAINRRAWSSRAAVKWFRSLEGWTDPGERAAIEHIRDEVRGRPILDIGVGAGRTVPLLRAISLDYVAVDYTQELVDACRKKHPDARILLGDARDLSMFDNESFALVVFSFNGIDAVNEPDRMKILREAHRVLRPGGIFLFSSHNRRGPGHGEPLSFGFYATRNPVKLAARLVRTIAEAPVAAFNHLRYSKLNEQSDDHSIMNAAAHAHGILVYYVTL